MRNTKRMLAPLALGLAALALPSSATAHPEACDSGTKAAGTATFTFAGATFGPNDDKAADDFCFSKREIARFNDSGSNLEPGQTARSNNMHLLSNLPKMGALAPETAFNSDIAFWGKYAFQGNYNGFQITDISDPENPEVVSQVNCPGAQNDISVWKNLVFLSTDSRRNDASCQSFGLTNSTTPAANDPNAEYWEGIKIFDWTNPKAPVLKAAVETDCGSHTHTIIPEATRVITYVSSYDLNVNAKDCRLTSTPNDDHDKISIIETKLDSPETSAVVAEPVIFSKAAGYPGADDGGFPGSATTRRTAGCHDITVYPAIDRAAGACMGEGVIMDISDPVKPKILSTITDPNFAFWHSATFFQDGSGVLFTDELGGGGQPTCNPTVGPTKGADIIYDLADSGAMRFRSYFKIPRTQSNTENCVAHNGNFIPTSKGDTYVQAWYQGGTSIVDLNDRSKPREVGFFDRGPLSSERLILGGSWSSYYYNGFIYSNDIQKGLDVMKFSDRRAAGAGANRMQYLNAQVQEPLRRQTGR